MSKEIIENGKKYKAFFRDSFKSMKYLDLFIIIIGIIIGDKVILLWFHFDFNFERGDQKTNVSKYEFQLRKQTSLII